MLLIKPGPVIGTGLTQIEPDFTNQRFVIRNLITPQPNMVQNDWAQIVDESGTPNGYIAENTIKTAIAWNSLVSTYVLNSGPALAWITAAQLSKALPIAVEQAPVP